jgi:hypothetical protein
LELKSDSIHKLRDGNVPEARDLFASMGYTPALADTEALLGESEGAAV